MAFRKVLRDNGQAANGLIAEMQATAADLTASDDPTVAKIGQRLSVSHAHLTEATDWLLGHREDPATVAASATPYLNLFATVTAGWLMARAAQAISAEGSEFAYGKRVTARFFADHILPRTAGLLPAVVQGADTVMALETDSF